MKHKQACGIFHILCCFFLFGLVSAKSRLDLAFEKYSYKSNFTDRELFQSTYTKYHLSILKNETKSLFNYAWDKYMEFGFPYDEVCPLSCKPNKRDIWDESNTVKNDALGNFSITFFDAIDTSIIMGDYDKFVDSVSKIKEMYSDFAIDSTIQIFETNIRLLGSLLTSHLYAIDPRRGFSIPDYDGFLLKLAYDLGKRLILSFSHTDDDYKFEGNDILKYFVFNFPRTNLLYGPKDISYNLKYEQCTAGITSLTLEFGLLSRLTNDTIFEDVAKRAVMDFWGRRTKLDLIPMAFDAVQRTFTDSITGIGASIDSFYEYALKYSILFDDDYFYSIWKDSYKALLTHSQNRDGIFTNLNVNNGLGVSEWIDSLGAFFPGLQVLAGDIKNSITLHRTYFKLWNNYGAVPKRWNLMPLRSEGYFQYLTRPYKDGDLIEGFDYDLTNEILIKNSVGLEWYPLRPELVESTYHLYTATKDPFFLRLGEDFLERLREHYIAPCGFSGSLDILNDRRQNRQESFVLSETLKYLYLLFDVDNSVQKIGNMIFTTEGHPIWYDKKLLEFDPIDKNELIEMNKWNASEIENPGFFSRLLNIKKFLLNQEFDKFRKEFYRDSAKVDPYIYRVRDLFAVETDKNGDVIGTKYGSFERTDKAGYDSVMYEEKMNLAAININMKEMLGLKLDPDYLDFDICENVNYERKSHKGCLLGSDIMKNEKELYRLDRDYAMTLRKPLYLLDRQPLEIDFEFYDLFGTGGICLAKQHTSEWEALMSTDSTFSIASIYKLKGEKNEKYEYEELEARDARDGDIFVAELDGLRFTLENLEVGSLDSRGDIITSEYVEEFLNKVSNFTGVHKDVKEVNSVVRLTKLNGLQLSENDRVWVRRGCYMLRNSENVNQAGPYVVIEDKVVENMFVQ